MAIVLFDPEDVIDFVPEYGGNRHSAAPCVIGIKYVPHSKVQSYSRLLAARAKGLDPSDTEKASEISAEVQKKQFCDNIASVSGLSIKGREITTPEELYAHGPSELIYELIRAMQSSAVLSEGQRKNS